MAKTMVITGASRGLGAAIARAAVRDGFDVAVNYASSKAEAEALCEELGSKGAKARPIQADVSTPEGVAHLFEEVDRQFGRIDSLVANAGISGAMLTIEQLTPDALESVLRGNVNSLVFTAREAVLRMSRKHGGEGGTIVVMSSVATRLGGRPGMLAYTMSKGACDTFTIAMSRELANTGIRVNALRPGVIRTSMHDVYGGIDSLTAVLPQIPLRRFGEPDEVAEAVLFLATERSSYVSGAILDIGGGR